MERQRLAAHFTLNNQIILHFTWQGEEKFYDKTSLQKLCEIIPKESIAKQQVVEIEDDVIHVHDSVVIQLKTSGLDIEIYYQSLCEFFGINELYQEKMWQQVQEKSSHGAKVEVSCEMVDEPEGRTYKLEVYKHRLDSVYKTYDHKKYEIA